MKPFTRRAFVKDAAMFGAAVPLLAEARPAVTFSDSREPASPKVQAQTLYTEARGRDAVSVLNDEQLAKLDVAVDRLKTQLPLLRSSPLPYDLEPAFVFHPRMHSRLGRKA